MAGDTVSEIILARLRATCDFADSDRAARALVLGLAEDRLVAGHREYGDWCNNRDWLLEQLEEAIDGCHYALAGSYFSTDRNWRDMHTALAEAWAQIALDIAEVVCRRG